MTTLTEFARRELEIAGLFSEESDYGGMLGNAVMELVEKFSEQGHSGCSAGMVCNLFNKLARFKPITPLTLKDDEWSECSLLAGTFQNRRNSAVFKEGKEGRPYLNDAYYMRTQTGSTWGGRLTVGDGRKVVRCYIKDVKNMPIVCIDIIDREVEKDNPDVDKPGSGWWVHRMKDVGQLAELEKHYDVEYSQEV